VLTDDEVIWWIIAQNDPGLGPLLSDLTDEGDSLVEPRAGDPSEGEEDDQKKERRKAFENLWDNIDRAIVELSTYRVSEPNDPEIVSFDRELRRMWILVGTVLDKEGA
jgi:hypothetical protein